MKVISSLSWNYFINFLGKKKVGHENSIGDILFNGETKFFA